MNWQLGSERRCAARVVAVMRVAGPSRYLGTLSSAQQE
jgi:hypothetical protein